MFQNVLFPSASYSIQKLFFSRLKSFLRHVKLRSLKAQTFLANDGNWKATVIVFGAFFLFGWVGRPLF